MDVSGRLPLGASVDGDSICRPPAVWHGKGTCFFLDERGLRQVSTLSLFFCQLISFQAFVEIIPKTTLRKMFTKLDNVIPTPTKQCGRQTTRHASETLDHIISDLSNIAPKFLPLTHGLPCCISRCRASSKVPDVVHVKLQYRRRK